MWFDVDIGSILLTKNDLWNDFVCNVGFQSWLMVDLNSAFKDNLYKSVILLKHDKAQCGIHMRLAWKQLIRCYRLLPHLFKTVTHITGVNAMHINYQYGYQFTALGNGGFQYNVFHFICVQWWNLVKHCIIIGARLLWSGRYGCAIVISYIGLKKLLNNGCRCFLTLDSSLLGQNGRHFVDDIFRYNWLMKRFFFFILIKVSLKFVPKGPIDNSPVLL